MNERTGYNPASNAWSMLSPAKSGHKNKRRPQFFAHNLVVLLWSLKVCSHWLRLCSLEELYLLQRGGHSVVPHTLGVTAPSTLSFKIKVIPLRSHLLEGVLLHPRSDCFIQGEVIAAPQKCLMILPRGSNYTTRSSGVVEGRVPAP